GVLARADRRLNGDALPAATTMQLDPQGRRAPGQRGPDRDEPAEPLARPEERAAQAVEARQDLSPDPAPRLQADDEEAAGKGEPLVDGDRDEADALRDRLGLEGGADDQDEDAKEKPSH